MILDAIKSCTDRLHSSWHNVKYVHQIRWEMEATGETQNNIIYDQYISRIEISIILCLMNHGNHSSEKTRVIITFDEMALLWYKLIKRHLQDPKIKIHSTEAENVDMCHFDCGP